MQQTIMTFPIAIEKAITKILKEDGANEWIKRAKLLHIRYMQREKDNKKSFITDYSDALAYLALRAPATYAQILGSLSAVFEMIPSWQPATMLDIGSGPGIGIWAANALFPNLEKITWVDNNDHFLSLGKKIVNAVPLQTSVAWKKSDITQDIDQESMYDIVLISNMLNELDVRQREKLLGQAFTLCRGIMVIVEPGTPFGSSIVQSVAKSFFQKNTLIAPYIESNFVDTKDYWLHFPQRFKRTEFSKRIRQHMREDSLMASDWEEAKYSYVAIGNVAIETNPCGRCVGPIRLQKGFLEIPILTKDELIYVKVMKRYKQQYAFASKLKWGQLIFSPLS